MKSIILPTQPKWIELTISGKKLREIRKTAPKPPFKVYLYCTYGTLLYSDYPNGNDSREIKLGSFKVSGKNCLGHQMNGKVVAEWICDKVYKITQCCNGYGVSGDIALTNQIARESCLDFPDLKKYLGDKIGYALHISALKVYDKPKELGEFRKKNCGDNVCDNCSFYGLSMFRKYCKKDNIVTHAPQNYIYVEDLEEV